MPRTMSRRTEITPLHSRLRWMWLLALWCTLSACAGGSGSSGFDALLAENNAIDKALASDGCEMVEELGLTICAANGATPVPISTPTPPPASPTQTPIPTLPATATPTPSPEMPTAASFTATPSQPFFSPTPTGTQGPFGTPTVTTTPPNDTMSPSPTPSTTLPPPTASATHSPPPSFTATPRMRPSDSPTPTATPSPGRAAVDTNISGTNMAPCAADGPAGTCTFVFTFIPVGLPSTTAYRVAVRSRNPDGDWQVFDAPGNSVTLQLDVSNPDTEYQIAVLAFSQDPGALPATVEILGDTGAELAFVTPLLRPN